MLKHFGETLHGRRPALRRPSRFVPPSVEDERRLERREMAASYAVYPYIEVPVQPMILNSTDGNNYDITVIDGTFLLQDSYVDTDPDTGDTLASYSNSNEHTAWDANNPTLAPSATLQDGDDDQLSATVVAPTAPVADSHTIYVNTRNFSLAPDGTYPGAPTITTPVTITGQLTISLRNTKSGDGGNSAGVDFTFQSDAITLDTNGPNGLTVDYTDANGPEHFEDPNFDATPTGTWSGSYTFNFKVTGDFTTDFITVYEQHWIEGSGNQGFNAKSDFSWSYSATYSTATSP